MSLIETLKTSHPWIRKHYFCITSSLAEKLDQIPEKDRWKLACIQGYILRQCDEFEIPWVDVTATTWKN